MNGKTGIVTGGASGIGKAVVERLLAAGAHIRAIDLNAAALETLTAECQSASLEIGHADVTRTDAADLAVQICVDRHGRIDFLVNAAGIVHPAVRLHEIGDADFDRVQAVNLFGSFAFYRSAARQMVSQNSGGAIVNVSSTAGIRPIATGGAYTASKHAIVGLTTTAASELAPHGVRINAICPGVIIDTPLFRANVAGGAAEAVMKMIPLGRLGQSSEVAELVLWLLSDEASYVTVRSFPSMAGYRWSERWERVPTLAGR